MARRSIEVPGLQHRAPIPQACVVGNLLVSGGISPVDPETGSTMDGTDEQVAMGHHVRGSAARQIAQACPHAAEPGDVQQFLAVLEAGFHPRVVGSQVTAAAGAAKYPAAGV